MASGLMLSRLTLYGFLDWMMSKTTNLSFTTVYKAIAIAPTLKPIG